MERGATKTLSAPLRVYWDLLTEKSGGLPSKRALGLAEDLAAMKVFFVTLRVSGGLRRDVGGVVAALGKGGVRVTVSVGRVEDFPGWDSVVQADGIDLSPEDAGSLEVLLSVVTGGAPKGKKISVSVVPSRDNLGLIKEAVSLSLEAGIRDFSLPNPNIVDVPVRAGDFALGEAERGAIKQALEDMLKPYGRDVRLGVHDLFLHQSLDLPGLGGRIEYAGCQAGDAIAYISGSGVLYPCASWPEPLGDLRGKTFKEAWSSEARKTMREGLRAAPSGCTGCPEVGVCKGGCRGLALALSGRGARDPNCEK